MVGHHTTPFHNPTHSPAPPNHTHRYRPHPRHMPPPHRMLSRNPAEKRVPAGPPLHSNLGRHRILEHRRIHKRSLETPPTIHHPLLENKTPPRRSSTKNHDNRQTRKLKRRRTSLHTSNHQMGAQRKNAAVHLSKDANQMQTIPGNKPGNNLHHRHQLTTAHPKSPASTKDAKQSSTAFLTLPGQGTVNLRICLLFAPPTGQSL